MFAASQCPKCSASLHLRNDRGDMVALVRCHGCNTYYPKSRTACRWCPPAAPRSNVSRYAALGMVAVAVLAGGTFGTLRLMHWRASSATRVIAHAATPVAHLTSAVTDSPRVDPMPVAVTNLPAPVTISPPAVSNPATPRADTTARVVSAAHVAESSPVSAPNVDSANLAPGSRVFARATTWANVRAERDLAAEVIGVVKPDSIVEIKEVRGSWRRVSTTGLAGWVDSRLFALVANDRR